MAFLEVVQDVFLLHEGHFAVDLGEFRLPVRAEILVAEAADDLEVAVIAGHHQQLLEGLGALRKGVELARIHARRHHKVAGALGGGLDEIRGLDLHEVLGIEIVPHLMGEPVAKGQGLLERVSPEVQITELGSDVLAAVALVFDCEGRGHGLVENIDGLNFYLDFSGGHLGVLL